MSVLNALISTGRMALSQPREAAVTLLSMGVPRAAIGPGFALIVVLSVLLGAFGELVAPGQLGGGISPFSSVLFNGGLFLGYSITIWKIGSAMGGKGALEESILLAVFFQAIFMPAILIQLFLLLVMPPLAGLFTMALLIFSIWVNVNFIDALHGFGSLGRSLGVFLMSSLAVAVGLILVIAVFGLSLEGMI
jgi:Yip1 domain